MHFEIWTQSCNTYLVNKIFKMLNSPLQIYYLNLITFYVHIYACTLYIYKSTVEFKRYNYIELYIQ